MIDPTLRHYETAADVGLLGWTEEQLTFMLEEIIECERVFWAKNQLNEDKSRSDRPRIYDGNVTNVDWLWKQNKVKRVKK